jgi:hypothetical protein
VAVSNSIKVGSIGLLVINVCNRGERYETACIFFSIALGTCRQNERESRKEILVLILTMRQNFSDCLRTENIWGKYCQF